MHRFRGGLVCKAHARLGLRVIKNKREGQYAVHASFDSNATEMAIGSDKEGKKVCPLADCSMGSQ